MFAAAGPTHTLSLCADAILAQVAAGRAPTKPRLLAAMSATIAGPKHDWGFLTGQNGPVVARDAQRFAPLLQSTSTPRKVFFYQYDERDDWGRAPCGPFFTREAALEALAADGWWHANEYPVAQVLEALKTQDSFTLFTEDDGFEDASPYSITILSYSLDAPAHGTAGVVGWQVEHADGSPYEGDDAPMSFEIFAERSAAQALADRHPGLVVVEVKEGSIEDPSWI